MSDMLDKLVTLDPAHRASFETNWTLVDRIFKLVQWALVIAIVAALSQRAAAAGTPNRWGLVLLGSILLLAWLFALGAWLTAYLNSRVPDIEQRPRIAKVVVLCLVAPPVVLIVSVALQLFNVLVNAQIMQFMK
jgi:hypothetical protein